MAEITAAHQQEVDLDCTAAASQPFANVFVRTWTNAINSTQRIISTTLEVTYFHALFISVLYYWINVVFLHSVMFNALPESLCCSPYLLNLLLCIPTLHFLKCFLNPNRINLVIFALSCWFVVFYVLNAWVWTLNVCECPLYSALTPVYIMYMDPINDVYCAE